MPNQIEEYVSGLLLGEGHRNGKIIQKMSSKRRQTNWLLNIRARGQILGLSILEEEDK